MFIVSANKLQEITTFFHFYWKVIGYNKFEFVSNLLNYVESSSFQNESYGAKRRQKKKKERNKKRELKRTEKQE